jgi:hypothetical protein
LSVDEPIGGMQGPIIHGRGLTTMTRPTTWLLTLAPPPPPHPIHPPNAYSDLYHCEATGLVVGGSQ